MKHQNLRWQIVESHAGLQDDLHNDCIRWDAQALLMHGLLKACPEALQK